MPTPAEKLLTSVLAGDAQAVAGLLDADPQLANLAERSPHRLSVLHIATGRGDLAVVELLLAAGATVDKRSHDGSTPLHEAAAGGQLEVVRALVAAGADTRATTNSGHSPFDAARAGGHRLIAELLAAHPQPGARHTFRGKREWS